LRVTGIIHIHCFSPSFPRRRKSTRRLCIDLITDFRLRAQLSGIIFLTKALLRFHALLPSPARGRRAGGEGECQDLMRSRKPPHPQPSLRAPRYGLQAIPASAAQSMLCETPLSPREREKGARASLRRESSRYCAYSRESQRPQGLAAVSTELFRTRVRPRGNDGAGNAHFGAPHPARECSHVMSRS
jgi:hypothetical protein